jgi:Isochorismatase family
MLRRDTIIIGGGATNRGVETSVREAFNLGLASVAVRECCWSDDTAAHGYSLDKATKMYARIRTLDRVERCCGYEGSEHECADNEAATLIAVLGAVAVATATLNWPSSSSREAPV